ncbi:MAG: cell division topological specificity factor MinE [Synergistaceae bacterium]|jgi:cell division topological specificity factor|nr:cell division topological specificity factor MinE [Synergistaceae bacterium]
MSLLSKFLVKEEHSGKTAKDRLVMALMMDRADISPDMMDDMKRDIISVIKNYVEIDEDRIELELARESTSVALVANIPVLTVRRRSNKRSV